jgi:hypothetical protein
MRDERPDFRRIAKEKRAAPTKTPRFGESRHDE